MSKGMLYLFAILAISIMISCTTVTPQDTPQNTAQVAAIRAMHGMLMKGDFVVFYRDWCHQHIAKQLTTEEFSEFMRSNKGKEVLRLFTEVLKAADEKAETDVLIARPEDEEGQYEFILKMSQEERRGGRRWHIELQWHDGKWKLLDTD
ncbi:MAG: hypothetical protein HZA48_02205 [Planctomycetes bacterium]|nr:hypothetical protein [Planctomycetota bacterium]